MIAMITLTLMSPPVGIMQKTIFHLKKHSVCKLSWNVKTHGRSVALWQLKPTIMLHPVITWIPICQNSSFSPKERRIVVPFLEKKSIERPFPLLWIMTTIEMWNSSSNPDIQAEVTDVVGGLQGIEKEYKVWYVYMLINSVGALIPLKQSIQYSLPTVIPLLTSKACPEIQEDSYWSNSSMKSGIDNWTLQNALLCLLTLMLSTPIFPGDIILRKRLFNVWNPQYSLVSPESAKLVSLFTLWSHIGNPCS